MDHSEQMTQLKAAGGVLFREKGGLIEILLIHRNGVWDLPKGKLEEGESIEECAVREVEEETGADSLVIVSHLCDTYHEYSERSVNYGKTTYWYLMKPSSKESLLQIEPQQEEGITALKWVEACRAEEIVHFDNLKTVVRAFLETL
jgi:8-oxo-dGTP pyrophosphatase MutT (NUDIX family)